MSQDLRARELAGRGPFGQRSGRFLQIGPIKLDPPASRLHERSGFGGQTGDVGRGQLDVVENRRPPHIAQLVGADHRLPGGFGEEPERR